MLPLKIVGFLPVQSGSAIMLPAEITTITGSDFDIDKLYIMLPEFKKVLYDYKQAHKDFGEDSIMYDILEHNEDSSELSDENLSFKEWFEDNKDKYKLSQPKFVKVQYDYNADKNKIQSREARNNALIDLMWGVLTHQDTVFKMLNPGGYDMQKKTARIISILENIEKIKDLGNTKIQTIEDLFKLSLAELNSINERFSSSRNTLDPSTQVYLHQRNMNGAKLVGIYANHNASHALFQLLEGDSSPKIKEEYSFKLYGKTLTKLNNITNEEGRYITRVVSGFLAASVDNGKDAFLADLNQNTITADMTMLLARLGYSSDEIGLFMAQPICKYFVSTINRLKGQGKSKKDIMQDIIDDIDNNTNKLGHLNGGKRVMVEDMTVEDMANNILKNKVFKKFIENPEIEEADIAYLESQKYIGIKFLEIFSLGENLSSLVQATRADTSNGGAGPTIADNINKIAKVKSVVSDKYFPIENADIIDISLVFNPETDTRKSIINKIMKSKIPYLQAFYTLGLSETQRLFENYFPFYNEEFKNIITQAKSLTRYDSIDVKTANNIYNEAIAYILSSLPFFGKDENSSISAYDKRKAFINDFPEHFKKLYNENEELQKNEFLKRLKYQKANKYSPVPLIVFKNVGHLTTILRDKYSKDWESLLYSNNEEFRKLALELFLYSYYRSGFGFGPSTFSHLAPISLRKAIPGYQEKLQELLTNPDSLDMFFEQHIYNHLDNRRLVPQVNINVENTSTNIFAIDSNGIVKGVNDKFTVQFSQTIFKSKNSDRGFIKSSEKIDGRTYYYPYKYVAIKYSNKMAYYKLSENEHSGTSEEPIYTYERIAPLGYANTFLEYEYGVPISKMKSVISNNDYNFVSEEVKERIELISNGLNSETPEVPDDVMNYLKAANQSTEDYYTSVNEYAEDTEKIPEDGDGTYTNPEGIKENVCN